MWLHEVNICYNSSNVCDFHWSCGWERCLPSYFFSPTYHLQLRFLFILGACFKNISPRALFLWHCTEDVWAFVPLKWHFHPLHLGYFLTRSHWVFWCRPVNYVEGGARKWVALVAIKECSAILVKTISVIGTYRGESVARPACLDHQTCMKQGSCYIWASEHISETWCYFAHYASEQEEMR